jgi:hypothetical protein
MFDNKVHTHIIGVLWYYEGSHLATFDDVVKSVKDTCTLREYFERGFGKVPEGFSRAVPLEKYMDRRVSTNLERFDYCPFCGEKIDWKKLKERAKSESMDSK